MKPTGVRLILRDGREIPCDTKLVQTDEDGLETWQPIFESDISELDIVNVKVAIMPGMTSLRLPHIGLR